jgi:hypothetical protein
MFALRALGDAAREVQRALGAADVEGARRGLRSLCSRDPSQLDAPQLVAASVESIAENSADSFVAPLDCVVVLGTLGYELTGMRQAFLTQGFRSAYMGWIHRETRDIEKFHNAKRLSHIPRLIWELESVYTIGNMVVRPDETKRQSIIDIKTGEMDYDEAVGWIGNMILDLEELDAEVGPSLPDEPYEEMNTWLLEARRRFG